MMLNSIGVQVDFVTISPCQHRHHQEVTLQVVILLLQFWNTAHREDRDVRLEAVRAGIEGASSRDCVTSGKS